MHSNKMSVHAGNGSSSDAFNRDTMYGCAGEIRDTVPDAEAKAYAAFMFIQLFISLFGNILVCVAILRFKQLQTLTNTLIFSLAVTDLLTPCVRVLYIAISMLKQQWIFDCTWCKLSSVLGVFLCAASIMHLCAISVERFVVIKWPLHHERLITKKRVMSVITAIWIIALLLSLFPYFNLVHLTFSGSLLDCEIYWDENPKMSVILAVFFFFLPFQTMTVTYYFIFKEVHRQTRRVSTISRNGSSRKRGRISTIRQEMKAVKTVIVVIGIFFVLWLPFFTVTAVRAYLPKAVPPSLERLVLGLAYANSSCNFVIYSVMNRRLRRAFYRLLFSCSHRPNETLGSVSDLQKSVQERFSKAMTVINVARAFMKNPSSSKTTEDEHRNSLCTPNSNTHCVEANLKESSSESEREPSSVNGNNDNTQNVETSSVATKTAPEANEHGSGNEIDTTFQPNGHCNTIENEPQEPVKTIKEVKFSDTVDFDNSKMDDKEDCREQYDTEL